MILGRYGVDMNFLPILALVVMVSVGCDTHKGKRGDAAPATGPNPYYVASGERASNLVCRASQLRHGDTASHVLAMLGSPDLDTQYRGKKYDAPILYRRFRYHIVKFDKTLVNEIKDEFVDVILGPDDRLREVVMKYQKR